MKIYFDGDSWSRGTEIKPDERRLSYRFSALVSKELGAEEHNISRGGVSNNRIARQLLVDNDISQYDLAIIQMVYPFRSEYYNDDQKKWLTICPSSIAEDPSTVKYLRWTKKKKMLERKRIDYEYWAKYYREIYNDTYGNAYEEMFYTAIRNHCELKNVKLILMSHHYHTKLNFDLKLQVPKYPQTPKGHPTEEGHRLIADDILKLL